MRWNDTHKLVPENDRGGFIVPNVMWYSYSEPCNGR